MQASLMAIGWLLFAQLDVPDRYAPRLERSRSAPPANINLDEADDPPQRRSPRQFSDESPPERRFQSSDENRFPTREDERESAQKTQPPDILAEALEEPQQGAVVGKELTLSAALSRTADRGQMLKIAQAYWKLAAAQAEYHWARDARERLKSYTESQTNTKETLSARATARAASLDAELAVVKAQQELADLLGGGNDRPLAIDRPHVGDYNTHYEEIFTGSRQPTPRIRLVNRTLPLLRKAIDLHGEAVVAAIDAVESIGQDVSQEKSEVSALEAALAQLQHERRAFIVAARDYNQQIAEYLFAVVPANTSTQELVSRLILKPTRSAAGERPRTPARASERESDSGKDEWDDLRRGRAEDGRTSRYRPEDFEDTSADAGAYQAFADLQSPQMTQKLGEVLHWDRVLPRDAGQPISLAECLRSQPAENRAALVHAFWRARERAAAFQAAVDRTEQLKDLAAVVIAARQRPGMAEAGVRLQAARQSALAARADALLALVMAQYDLTVATGRRLDGAWLLANTAPQAGGYEVGTQAAKRAPHWAERVELEHHRLQEQAAAVVRSDAQRASLVTAARASHAEARGFGSDSTSTANLDKASMAVSRQYDETLAFLQDMTDYNLAIAQFAMSVSPRGISAEELLRLLVIERRDRES